MLTVTAEEHLRMKLKKLVQKTLTGNPLIVLVLNREIDKASTETLSKLRKEILELLL